MKKLWDWITNHIVLSLIICSVVFAIIVHCLFSASAPNNWWEHKWEAGDILTYVSTVALGLLAVWQNQRFKDENDKAQKRLEKISSEANELNVISKITENESQYITLLDEAFNELLDACGHESISIAMMGEFDGTRVSIALKRINQTTSHFVQVFFSGYQLNNYNAMPLLDNCNQISTNASQILSEYLHTKKVNSSALYDSLDHYSQTKAEKEIYICKRRNQLNKILLEKLTLAEIRSLYIRQEEDTNGKNENGVD